MASTSKDRKKKSFFNNGDKPARTIAGWNVYQDDRGQNIMYIKSSGTGYIIQKKDESAFTLYHNRLAIAVAVFMLVTSLFNNWQTALIIALVLLILMEFRYRRSWLPSLARIENFKPKTKRTMVNALVELDNKPRTLLLGILYLLFGVLFVYYVFTTYSILVIQIGSLVILAGCLYMSVNYFRALARM